MNTNIEILLDKTAEYLLKYDASEEGQKCAHEIQDYYEYRPNYILGCLDYARKFAHKAQTIDIDEDPNEFISVANKAYYAWASSMKTQNENIKKNKIKLTESRLKQIVAESVKKVLREGKTINNKPFFSRAGRYMKPGEELHGYHSEGNEFLRQKGYENFHDAFGAVMRGELDKTTFDKWYDEHMKAVNKHNDRLEYNWDEGNYDDYNYKTLAVSDYDDVNY